MTGEVVEDTADTSTDSISGFQDPSLLGSEFELTEEIDTTNHDDLTDFDGDDSVLINEEQPIFNDADKEVKVNIMDIFKIIKPSKVRKEEESIEEYSLLSDPIDQPPEDINKPIVEEKPQKTGITANDILTGNRKKPVVVEEEPVIIPIDEDLELKEVVKSGITIADILTGKKKPIQNDTEVVELLSSDEEYRVKEGKRGKRKYNKKDKQKNKESPDRSLIINLKYKPQHKKLLEIEQNFKKSASRTISAKDLFHSFHKKKELMVKLKVNSDKLREISKPSFFVEGNNKTPGAKSYLEMLQHKSTPAKNPIYKLKEVPTPDPERDQLHVTYDQIELQHRKIDLPIRDKLTIADNTDYSSIPRNENNEKRSEKFQIETTFPSKSEILDLARQRVPNLESDSRFKKFYKMLKGDKEVHADDVWTNIFKPKSSKEILINPSISSSIKSWIEDSFLTLKRNVKRPNFKKQRKQLDDEFDDFIINDDEEDLTEEESYVPLLVISGPSGIGKSTIVYSIVEDELSGYVYEVNASQDRGRKDIMSNLTEISTTQLVHHNENTKKNNDFQKGVILLEDVDILFETDRGFWSVLESLLMISRRPIILTCSDLSKIPSYILKTVTEEGNLFNIERQPLELLKDYLFLIGIVNNLSVDDDILIELIEENDYDLRKCLTNFQVLYKGVNPSCDEILHISKSKKLEVAVDIQKETSIESFSEKIDLYSVADIIGNGSKSLINHEYIENEVISDDIFLNEEELYTTPLPFEFNISKEIFKILPLYSSTVKVLNIKEIILQDKSYFKSRLKEFKRFTRGALVSSILFDETAEDYYDKSVFEILPKSKYITEVSPMLREFARYDLKVDKYNQYIIDNDPENRTEIQLMKEHRLLKRKFDDSPKDLLKDSLEYWKDP